MIKKVRYFFEYIALRSVMFFLNMLSDRHIQYVASIFGILWYYVDPEHRSIAKENISYAFPEMSEKNKNKILRESYKHIIESFITFPRISRFNRSNIDRYFEFQCEEYYKQAVEKGKGVFILTGHLGNWEFAAAAQSIKNGGLIAVAKDIHNPYVDRYVKAIRRSAGIEVVKPRNAVFKLLKGLKQGKTIAMLLDQNTLRHEAVFVNFFGKPAATQYAMALMALKTGASVVPGYIVKNYVQGGYIIRYEKPIFVDQIEDKKEREEAIIALTQRFTTILENQIKRMPGQWFWVHNRFKTTPQS